MQREIYYNKKDLTIESTKEDVAQFFLKYFKCKEQIINNILKEDISGDILIELKEKDYKSLGIVFGDKVKIKKYLDINKNNFVQKPMEFKDFFNNFLNLEKELNINVNQMLVLENVEMNNLGLNLG